MTFNNALATKLHEQTMLDSISSTAKELFMSHNMTTDQYQKLTLEEYEKIGAAVGAYARLAAEKVLRSYNVIT